MMIAANIVLFVILAGAVCEVCSAAWRVSDSNPAVRRRLEYTDPE